MYIPLEQGEEIVTKVHKHWWFIATRVILVIFVFAAPILLWNLLNNNGIVILTSVSSHLFLALAALWALVCWIMFWQFWTLYYMDTWIVTNKRLIDIDYIAFFDRNIATLRLDRIQDITIEVDSVFGNLLGFGTLIVQTAGSDKEFRVENISHPDRLRDIISKTSAI